MPIRPPALDDRSFDDLVQELVARIPAHTPEWTNPRVGDPGRTMIDLFAWLADTLLYRVNLIPERQRLAFLRLLGIPMRPALAATGLVTLSIDDPKDTDAVYLVERAVISGPPEFETRAEMTVLPVAGVPFYKRRLSRAEAERMDEVIQQLQVLYDTGEGAPTPYMTTPVFPGGEPTAEGFDLIQDTVDGSLWIALLAAKPDATLMGKLRATLAAGTDGRQQLLNVGIAPKIQTPELFEEIGERARIPVIWEVSTATPANEEPVYVALEPIDDTTAGFTRQGIVRLALPGTGVLGAPFNDVLKDILAGVGMRPPRLDDPDQAARLLGWLRLRPRDPLHSLELSWAGINAVEIDQRRTVRGRVVGQSDGSAGQSFQIANECVEVATLQLQVEEPGAGYRPWQRIEDLNTAGRDDSVYMLDAEAGTVTFGDGMRGRIPAVQQRIRVELMRTGGGAAGNLPPGKLSKIEGRDRRTGAKPLVKLKVAQTMATAGGVDAETLEAAERRIPALFRNRDRAVTEEDYRTLAGQTPGVHVGRVDVMPRFKPQQRMRDVPGVVSLMVLPYKADAAAPNPRPDRPFLETISGYLSARRPIGTELYVIGCEYVPVAVSVAISLRYGFGQDAVLSEVAAALRKFLWPLAPGGLDEKGWVRGRAVRDLELEVVVGRVAGVDTVNGLNLFQQDMARRWVLAPRATNQLPRQVKLLEWQLPELLRVVAMVGDIAPVDLAAGGTGTGAGTGAGTGTGGTTAADGGISIPLAPRVC